MNYTTVVTINGDERINSAAISLSLEQIHWILQKMELAQHLDHENSEFFALAYFDNTPVWYEDFLEIEEAENAFMPADAFELIELLSGEDPAQSLESAMLHITENTIYWTCDEKYTAGSYETDSIGIHELTALRDRMVRENYLAELQQRKGGTP